MSENGTTTKNKLVSLERIQLMGVEMDNLTMDETIDQIDRIIQEREPCQHVVVNVNKIIKAQRDRKLRDIINGCPLISVDGMPLVWVSRLLGKPLKARVAGIDLFQRLLEYAQEKGAKVSLLGATDSVLKDVVYVLASRYPRLKIVGYRNGYWKSEEEADIVKEVARQQPDFVFVALPSPRKEYFIHEYLDRMNTTFVMGVGGSFDVLSGRTKRAPVWMQNCGLEWFYRFLQEPGRLFKRYFVEGFQFIGLVIKEVFKKKS